MLAADVWSHLKQRTTQSGIIGKFNSMHAAITMKCSKSKEMNSTIGEIRVNLTSVFEDVTPTQDEWFIVLLLNSLEGMEYNWL